MSITPTSLRKDIFNILDRLYESGETLEIERNGHIFKLVPPKKMKKLDKLEAHDEVVVGDSEELVSYDWSGEWKPSI